MTTQNIYDLADTWNAGATTFTAIKMNVTDTASAAGSLLMDLQVGGSSKYAIFKNGGIANGGIRFGNADAATAVAQTLSVQSVVAGTTNTAGANFTITGSQGTGTGAGGSIIFQVAPAGSSGSAQNALVNAFKINPTGTLTLGTLQYSGLSFGTGGEFNVDILGTIGFKMYSNGLSVPPATQIGWASGALPVSGSGTLDLILARDAANTLALRNGTNAQTFRVYNTTDGTNYERGFMRWASSVLEIGTEKSGTGSNRGMKLTWDNGNGSIDFITSAANAQGTRIYTPGNGKIAIVTSANGAGTLCFGLAGNTTAQIKGSGTTLQVRLGDDSAFASIQGKITTDTAYQAGAPTATGYLILYDSTGTAYRVPAVLN